MIWYLTNGIMLAYGTNVYCLPADSVGGPRPSNSGNRYTICAVSHWFFVWFWLTWAVTWSAVVLHCAIIVAMKRSPFNKWTQIVTYVVVIAFPVLGACVVAGYGSEGNYQPWCIESVVTPAWVPMVFFLVPLLICMVVCFASITFVLVLMARVTDGLSQWHLLNNVRLLVSMFLGLSATSLLFAFRFLYLRALTTVGGSLSSAIQLAVVTFFNCLALSGDCSISAAGTQVNYVFYAATNAAINFSPTIACFLFVSQPAVWKDWDTHVAPWKGIINLGKLASADSATATTAGSSSSSSTSDVSGSTYMSDLS